MELGELVHYLDDYLRVRDLPDFPGAHNGLQVEGPDRVHRVALAVDACAATIGAAAEAQAELLLVHHGLFWGSTAPVTGPYYRRLSGLIGNRVALYAAHLPLDVHPEVGNNHVLARGLGLTVCGTCVEFEGLAIGVWAETRQTLADLTGSVRRALGVEPKVIAAGTAEVRRVAVVTGGAGTHVADVAAAGCDTLVTGEGPHHTYFDAEELGVNLVYAGHYATETVGLRALGQHLEQRLSVETIFVDHPTGL